MPTGKEILQKNRELRQAILRLSLELHRRQGSKEQKRESLRTMMQEFKHGCKIGLRRIRALRMERNGRQDTGLTAACQSVLQLRYIECASWESISQRVGYSLRQIHRFHLMALRRLK